MDVPENLIWSVLTGDHARLAVTVGDVSRYASGLPPLVAFRDPHRPAWRDLAACSEPGEALYCALWAGEPPCDWTVQAEGVMARMVWQAAQPAVDTGGSVRQLQAADVDAMRELVDLTRPGPFGTRNLELGTYYGRFDGDRLVAMAGERMQAGRLREVSAVCTHPDCQGRGLGRSLVARLVREQVARGDIPFLHVMLDNPGAYALYQRMGFAKQQEMVVRVIQRR